MSQLAQHRDSLYIPSLDGIRALSFFLVFLAHAGLGGTLIPGGFGVTVFFLLSGFLITTLLRMEYTRHQNISLKNFYLRRVLRILPPLYVTLMLAVVLYSMESGRLGAPFAGTLSQVLQVANYYQIYADKVDMLPGTGVLWSLAVEEHFYLIFPLLYLWLAPRFPASGQVKILLSLCALALAWRCMLVFHFDAVEGRTYYATDTRFDSILLGCAFAIVANPVLRDSLCDRIVASMRWLIPLCVVVLMATFVYRDPAFRETFRYTLQGVALIPLFIAAIHYQEAPLVRFLNLPFMRYLGVLSYTLYLSHEVILESIRNVWPENAVLVGFVSFVLAMLFATIVHHGIERPCAKIRKRLSKLIND